jgi:hypothetical protein
MNEEKQLEEQAVFFEWWSRNDVLISPMVAVPTSEYREFERKQMSLSPDERKAEREVAIAWTAWCAAKGRVS